MGFRENIIRNACGTIFEHLRENKKIDKKLVKEQLYRILEQLKD